VTFPLRTSTDLNTVLSALDGDVVAVMLARLAVLEAKAYSSGEVAVQFLYGPVSGKRGGPRQRR